MCAYIRKHLEELHVLVFRPVRCSEDLSKCFRSIETWVLFMLPVLKRPMCRSCIFYGLSWICFSSSAAMHSKPFSLIVLWVPPSFFFDTPFSFLCAHKNCCTHATSFTQRLVIQLARSFLPSYFLMHLSSMCLFRAFFVCTAGISRSPYCLFRFQGVRCHQREPRGAQYRLSRRSGRDEGHHRLQCMWVVVWNADPMFMFTRTTSTAFSHLLARCTS